MRQCGGTPSLDGVCARRPRCAAGRDEETVPRSNKETDGKGRSCRACSGITLIPAGPSTASDPPRPLNPKRTNDVLRKPDNCKSYGQQACDAAHISVDSVITRCETLFIAFERSANQARSVFCMGCAICKVRHVPSV